MATAPPGDPARVEVVGADDPGARWTPHVGAETLALLAHMGDDLDEPTRDRVRDEALAVLRACTPPTDPAGSETGLVLGQVQSGKTMSFTTVAALARDNGYPLVIVVTGTSVPLSNQSKTRLERDLRLQTREDRKWQHFHNPRVRGHHIQAISAKLAEWRDARIPEAVRRTVLITAMKNHKHLAQLLGVLQRLPLERIPVLVIDDEADQAGLNNLVNQGRESTTYRCLVGIRQAIPHHTYLQYTATPQAPLLINVIDALSPRFAEVLTPGPDYVGGQQFFVEHANLVRTIPAGDIVTRGNPLNEPPDSLLQALRVFFLGVAAGWVTEDARGNRSMMVHPSRERFLHGGYHRWVTETKTLWLRLLDLPEEDPDRAELLADLRGCHDDLAATVRDLPGFDDLLSALPAAIRATQVWEVNTASGPTPAIDWRADYSHILVGGQAMDRGFTVNGLTVTYMPRGLGTGTADTIQQRARFFGYKRQYLGYCRIYLETAARDAYRRYVEHEEDIRQRLIEHRLTGRPLDEWKRAFFLSQALRPTRRSVMSLIPLQSVLSDKWYTPAAPHESSEAVVSNRAVIDGFLGGLTLGPDPGSPDRTEMQKHDMAADVPLAQVVSQLLTRLRIVGADDSPRFTGLLLQVQAYLDGHPEAVCRVYHMSRGASRERTVDGDDQIPNLFQGAAPVDPPQLRGSVYPGDREIRGETGLTVQVHRLRVVRPSEVLADVPTVAIWVPAEMAREWLVQ